ncbi:MAG: hypothetical protein K8F91_20240, partial [Candidatus Obscuribacterales bacterium]|nr:hypothetical protein [Candidatus Obscuribacterales bacterium]
WRLVMGEDPLQDEQSPTSLHLTLDHVALKEATEKYLNDLQSLTEEHEDIVGFAFAINGELNSADVYRCHDLFSKMWPRLLKAAAFEALSQAPKKREVAQPTRKQIEAFLEKAEQAQGMEKATSGKSRIVIKESEEAVLFETYDISNGDSWVHRNYVAMS